MNLFIRSVLHDVDEQPAHRSPTLCEVELTVWTCIFICTYAQQLHPSIRLSVATLSLPAGQALAVDTPTTCTMVMPDELEQLKLLLMVCLHGDFPC